MEREIQDRMEERRREQFLKSRESVVRRRPAWRALRAAARYSIPKKIGFRRFCKGKFVIIYFPGTSMREI